eukprot:s254_g25.t1
MIQVTVAPPSGNNRKKLELDKSSKVGDLKRLAQKTLGEAFLSLVTAEGHVLKDLTKSLEAAGVSDGDHLTAVVQQGKLAATAGAFALWSYGGDTIAIWGHHNFTRNCFADRNNLGSVQLVQGTRSPAVCEDPPFPDEYQAGAFAAILEDGSVMTWGQPECGGNSSAVSGQLKNVQQVQATSAAFAAILSDGSVVTWGDDRHGSDSSAVQDQLRSVQKVGSTWGAFAGILSDGSVVTWGNPRSGGDSSHVRHQLKNVTQIATTDSAFAAILQDGSVVTWGQPECGGNSSEVQQQLRSVQQVQATGSAFAAILADGSVVTWGNRAFGGDSSTVTDQLRNVKQVQGTKNAFAAILAEGSVVTWGDADCGGDSSAVQDRLRNVKQIEATDAAFAAILANRSVVTWGSASCGGDNSEVKDHLQNVQQIQGTESAFAAIRSDGSLVAWGNSMCGSTTHNTKAGARREADGLGHAIRSRCGLLEKTETNLRKFGCFKTQRWLNVWETLRRGAFKVLDNGCEVALPARAHREGSQKATLKLYLNQVSQVEEEELNGEVWKPFEEVYAHHALDTNLSEDTPTAKAAEPRPPPPPDLDGGAFEEPPPPPQAALAKLADAPPPPQETLQPPPPPELMDEHVRARMQWMGIAKGPQAPKAPKAPKVPQRKRKQMISQSPKAKAKDKVVPTAKAPPALPVSPPVLDPKVAAAWGLPISLVADGQNRSQDGPMR